MKLLCSHVRTRGMGLTTWLAREVAVSTQGAPTCMESKALGTEETLNNNSGLLLS